MTIMFYETSEGVQSKTTQSWEQVASKTGTLRAVGNFLSLYAEYGGVNANKDVGIRVLVDGVEKGFDYHTPSIAGQYKAFSCFGVIEPSVEAEHTISLEVIALDTGQTINVRRIRLMVVQT